MRTWFIILLAAILLGSCSGSGGHPLPSLEQEILRSLPRDYRQFQVLAQDVNPEGDVAVVFSYRTRTSGNPWPEDYTLAYQVFERLPGGEWQSSWLDLHTVPTLVRVAFPIPFDVYQDGYTAVYGPLQSAQVQTVEVAFSNGEVLRQPSSGLGFLFFYGEKPDVCELRFFDRENSLLERKVPPGRPEASDECPASP